LIQVQFYQRNHRDRLLAKKQERTLSSETFAAGFGSALATIDANGDGRDDLLVSAPFSDTEGRGGSVFLFINIRGELKTNGFLEIRGRAPEGQFGLAVSRAGDLNRDGFQDFAVGAPYEGGGTVYIFLGAVEGVAGAPRVGRHWLKAEQLASQVIRAEQLAGGGRSHLPVPPTLATFGSSLAGGMDMDSNGYPVRNPEDSKRAMLGMCYILDPDLSLPNKDLGATHVMAVREALHGKSLTPKGGFDNHDRHGVCQASTM
jgi:hypothetical protein